MTVYFVTAYLFIICNQNEDEDADDGKEDQ